jgi:putative hydrolase of the HAD superfamily
VTDIPGKNNITVILFDLGGVLLHLHDVGQTFGVAGDEREFHRRWILSRSVREFERGAIDFGEFAEQAVEELKFPYCSEEFLSRFNSWPGELYAGVPELLGELAVDYNVALLSNTNALHWQRDNVAGQLEPVLDHAFLSFRTGLLKPDDDAFGQVVNHYDCHAGEILFLDDNMLNIDAAKAFGIRVCLTRGIDDVRQALTANGVIPG